MCAPNFKNRYFWTSNMTYIFEKPTYTTVIKTVADENGNSSSRNWESSGATLGSVLGPFLLGLNFNGLSKFLSFFHFMIYANDT